MYRAMARRTRLSPHKIFKGLQENSSRRRYAVRVTAADLAAANNSSRHRRRASVITYFVREWAEDAVSEFIQGEGWTCRDTDDFDIDAIDSALHDLASAIDIAIAEYEDDVQASQGGNVSFALKGTLESWVKLLGSSAYPTSARNNIKNLAAPYYSMPSHADDLIKYVLDHSDVEYEYEQLGEVIAAVAVEGCTVKVYGLISGADSSSDVDYVYETLRSAEYDAEENERYHHEGYVIVEGTATRKDFEEYKDSGDPYGLDVDWGDAVAEGEEHPDPEYMASNWGEPVWVLQEQDGWKAWKKGTGWRDSKDEEFGKWEWRTDPSNPDEVAYDEDNFLVDTEEEALKEAAKALLAAMEAAGDADEYNHRVLKGVGFDEYEYLGVDGLKRIISGEPEQAAEPEQPVEEAAAPAETSVDRAALIEEAARIDATSYVDSRGLVALTRAVDQLMPMTREEERLYRNRLQRIVVDLQMASPHIDLAQQKPRSLMVPGAEEDVAVTHQWPHRTQVVPFAESTDPYKIKARRRRYVTITAACLRRTAVLEQRDHDGRKEWALVGGNGRVLKWFGAKKPSTEAVQREENRVKMFEHMDDSKSASISKTAKFMNDSTAICLKCDGPLSVQGVARNPKHLYELGQLYACPCGQSTVRANYLRKPRDFLNYLDGKGPAWNPTLKPEYTGGFCNDGFCGFDDGDVMILQNGIDVPGFGRVERAGHKDCPSGNTQIAWDIGKEDRERDTDGLMRWWAKHRSEIEDYLDGGQGRAQ